MSVGWTAGHASRVAENVSHMEPPVVLDNGFVSHVGRGDNVILIVTNSARPTHSGHVTSLGRRNQLHILKSHCIRILIILNLGSQDILGP